MSKDAAGKVYFDDPERIADLLNGYCFEGEQIIRAEEVEPGEGQLVWEDKQKNMIRNQDMVHKIIRGANCFIFNLEQQSYVDPSMVLRSLTYTVGQYEGQRREIQQGHKQNQDLERDEWLARFSEKDRLKPVLVLVIYLGEKPWRGARTLHELLDWRDIPEEWKRLFADHQMHLLEVGKIEDITVYQSDLKLLFGFLQRRDDDQRMRDFLEEFREDFLHTPDDLKKLIGAYSNHKELKKITQENDEEEFNMCKAIDDMIRKGEERGRREGEERGRREGEERGRQEGRQLVNTLNLFLIRDGRYDDLKQAAADKDYQKKLFKEYAL